MKRTNRAFLLLLWVTGVGCASGYTERHRLAHPGWTPRPPIAGDSLEETLASLQSEPQGPFQVSVRELRVLRVDVEPWKALSVDSDIAGREAQTIAVVADRRCKVRRGIRFFGSERVSWYIFVAGGLLSYDHVDFGEACEPRSHYLPTRTEYLATERALVRYAASRYPETAPTAEEMLSKGLVLVSAGRIPDAERMLRSADREIDLMSARAPSSPQKEREALEEKEKSLRAMRAKLSRAITAAQRQQAAD